MRRTYRSKKETGGGLDHKELLQNLDERSSVFHAFFIQNIKQTKRELSCVGPSHPYGVASKKVRKRKYVKRIVADVESSPQESMSKSTYLTPDKSIRVNKPIDPFDLLLNSSPISNTEYSSNKSNPITSKVDKLPDKKHLKKYPRRKPIRAKKFNYSSSSTSDSDKENSIEQTQNSSDIKAFSLIVEQDANCLTPKYNDSINKIVESSLLNKLRHKSFNESISNSFSFKKANLTKNMHPPMLQMSPLCSTPFKAKYRGESIYKFSPITKSHSPLTTTIVDENKSDCDSSIIISNRGNLYKSKITEEYPQSPIIGKITCSRNKWDISNKSKNTFIDDIIPTPNNITNISSGKAHDPQKQSISAEEEEASRFHSTEVEPFLGFSISVNPECLYNKNTDIVREKEDFKNNNTSFEVNTETEHEDPIQFSCVINISAQSNDVVEVTFEHKSKEAIEINCETNVEMIKNRSDAKNEYNENRIYRNNSVPDDIIFQDDKYENCHNYDPIENCVNYQNIDVCDNANSSNLLQVDNESLYDTCSSEESCIQNCYLKDPTILIKRMNDSSFFRYYKKMPGYGSDEKSIDYIHSISNESLEDFASLNSSSRKSGYSAGSDAGSNVSDNEANANCTSILSNEDSEPNSNSSIKEDKCISFVTTRRRNELTNNSILTIFSDSCCSSSTECDKTVLSNNGHESPENTKEVFIDYTLIGTNELVANSVENKQSGNTDTPVVGGPDNDIRESFITTRKSSIKPRKSSLKPKTSTITTRRTTGILSEGKSPTQENSRMTLIEGNSGIVLQPGKKWERSLSIYKRMTIMADQFNQSILEDEPMHTKGRKYRQSVLSTMEMQESKGSLHNESTNSRRSTFVSKPNRSTIRILKDASNSRLSVSSTTVFDDLKGFLNEECNDTIIELSKLSIADQTHEGTVIANFHDTSSRITTARDYVLRRCNQTDTILFDECYPDTVLKNCHKIGEGVYGEVFLWRARDGRARVLKIVPIAGDIKVNGEAQKDFHEIISEIVIAMELSALRAPIADIERHFDEGKSVDTLDLHSIEYATDVFNEVLAVRCVYGSYPSRLLDLWDLYDECKGSENDNPAVLPADQQYMVLELANAGQDLESYQFNNAEQAHALFLQVAYGLAVAEEAFQFEHRDLHWGNVLIAPTEQKFATFVVRGRCVRVARCGVAGTVIDYSLSRVALALGAGGESAALYNDLAGDDELFGAVGDYQFQVYRLMREKLGNDWKNFEPYTNILWLHYTVDKMITALRYKRTNTKVHKHFIEKLKGIKDRILEYGSVAQFVLTDDEI